MSKSRGNTIFRQWAVDTKEAENVGGYPTGPCPLCGRVCRVYWPRGGDGSARITFWHKDVKRGKWCRAEVDVEEVSFGGAQ